MLVNTPYDDVFRTLLNDCSSLIIPLVNEIFHESYSGDEAVEFYPNEHFLSKDEIFAALWDYDESPSELSLRVYIAELRKILGKDRIINASKLGYKYL